MSKEVILRLLWYFFIGYVEVSICLILIGLREYRLLYIDMCKKRNPAWFAPVFVVLAILMTPTALNYKIAKDIMKRLS
jgi:hypothetical protein